MVGLKLKAFAQQRKPLKKKTTHRMGANLANEVTDKGLVSKIYKHLIPFYIKKTQMTQLKNGQNI